MNSMAAVAFHLLGEEAMADRWARTACYMWMGRERGHAEGIFSAAWGPVGAALAPKEELHAFMNQMRWAYEMGRTRDGGITFMRGSRWTYPNMTAATGMFLCLPERRLQILGGDSIFAQRPPHGLEKAAQLYKDKKWGQLRTLLVDTIKAAEKGDVTADRLASAKKLLAAHDRLEKHAAATLVIIEQSIQDGMLATAQTQLDLLAKMLGEEREQAARLRKKLQQTLGDGKPQDPKPEKPAPLIDQQELVKQLELAKGGVGDGFAHSPAYIQAANTRGFEGMTPRQIAGFLGHFSGGPAGGAVTALASHGEETLPLIAQLLKDSHHGIRAGAVATLTQIYKSDSEEYRTEVPQELTQVITLLRPMITDESRLVRSEVGTFVQQIRVLNDDIYETLNVMAVDTLNNPEVMNMYGFFSNHPPHGALELFSHYCDNPLVRAHVSDMLRFAVRKRGSLDSYWYAIVEFPHRILITIGPEALPTLDAFCKSEEALYKQIEAGEVEQPGWWKEDSIECFTEWRRQMEITAELIRCMHGKRPTEQSIGRMCEIYLSSRPWGAWERQRIRDHLVELGPKGLPMLRRSVADQLPALTAQFDRQIAVKQAEVAAETDKRAHGPIQKEIEAIEVRKGDLAQRVEELRELASLVKSLQTEAPSEEDVQTVCRYYVKRPWGNQHPFVKDNCSYVRPLDENQLVLARDTLQLWGKTALPTLRTFVDADERTLVGRLRGAGGQFPPEVPLYRCGQGEGRADRRAGRRSLGHGRAEQHGLVRRQDRLARQRGPVAAEQVGWGGDGEEEYRMSNKES